jgi:citrate synthase
VFGLPPIVGDSIGGAIVAAIAAFAGHKHGRRTEKKAKANG